MRVVSLLPSATELLCAIPGGRQMLVGRSHECDHPPGLEHLPVLTAQRLTRPGDAAPTTAQQIDQAVRAQLQDPLQNTGSSLYTLDAPRLASLEPDIILTQDLCHVCSIDLNAVRSVVSQMPSKPGRPAPRILSLNPTTIEDVLDDLLHMGEAVGLADAATATCVTLRARLSRAMDYVNPFDDGPSVAFLEWTDPLFVGGHWIPQLIERAGGRHPLNPTVPVEGSGAAIGPQQASRKAGKSIAVPPEVLLATRHERLIIAPCGVPLAATADPAHALTVESMVRDLERQPWWPDLPAVRAARAGRATIALVDGNQMFARPGPRLIDAAEWLTGWLNSRPELMPKDFPWRRWA